MNGDFANEIDDFFIIDCRFEYEYNGGHIKGALNIDNKEKLYETFFEAPRAHRRSCVVFHCEFSSHRGPKM